MRATAVVLWTCRVPPWVGVVCLPRETDGYSPMALVSDVRMAHDPPRRVSDQPSLLLRAVWFLLVGWWATGIWLGVAWLLLVFIITIPIGVKMINAVPLVLSLKSPSREFVDQEMRSPRQRNLLVRAVWFVFVGWWASLVWMAIAYIFTVTIVGIPVAIWMYGKLPAVVSLYRY